MGLQTAVQPQIPDIHTSFVVGTSIDIGPLCYPPITYYLNRTLSIPAIVHLRFPKKIVHINMEALRSKIVIANYAIMLSMAIYLSLGGYLSQFYWGACVGAMVTLCGLNFYLYYSIPAASPAAAGVEEKG